MEESLGETVLVLAVFVLLFAGFCFAWLKFLEWTAGQLAKRRNIQPEEE